MGIACKRYSELARELGLDWKYEIERGIKQAKSFSPNPIDIKLGNTVTWINSHRQGNTITSDTAKFDSGNIGQG
ncbi:MAG TPA: hypothetical protein VIP56_09975 [Nitrososphaeraceae archaeon]